MLLILRNDPPANDPIAVPFMSLTDQKPGAGLPGNSWTVDRREAPLTRPLKAGLPHLSYE